MPSIYSVNAWTNNRLYKRNEIVSSNSDYYYAVSEHTSSVGGQFPSNDLSLWNGYLLPDDGGTAKPYFFWIPSYNLTVNNSPRVRTIKFGDGWEQRMADGLNSTLLQLDVSFDNRDLYEAGAILHFLDQRAGVESFFFYPPDPFTAKKLWVCDSHSLVINYYNNYTIKATFREVIY